MSIKHFSNIVEDNRNVKNRYYIDVDDIKDLLDELKSPMILLVNIKSTLLNIMKNPPIGLSFSNDGVCWATIESTNNIDTQSEVKVVQSFKIEESLIETMQTAIESSVTDSLSVYVFMNVEDSFSYFTGDDNIKHWRLDKI